MEPNALGQPDVCKVGAEDWAESVRVLWRALEAATGAKYVIGKP